MMTLRRHALPRHDSWLHRTPQTPSLVRPAAQASRELGPRAFLAPVWEVALLLLLIGAAIAVLLLAGLANGISAPFPDPGRLPSSRTAGY